MTTSRLMAGASRFAHFTGLARQSHRASDDDDDQRSNARASDDDDDDNHEDSDPADAPANQGKGKRSRRAADDDDDAGDDEPKGKRSKASDDDDEPAAKGKRSRRAADDDDDAGDDEPKGKGSRRAADDDDDDGDEDDDKREMTGRGRDASARRRERARCAAIFAHPSAAHNVALAADLAFETTMTRQEAIAVLRGQARRGGSRAEHDDRDDRQPVNRHARADRSERNVRLNSDDAMPSSARAVSSSWDAAWAKAGAKVSTGR